MGSAEAGLWVGLVGTSWRPFRPGIGLRIVNSRVGGHGAAPSASDREKEQLVRRNREATPLAQCQQAVIGVRGSGLVRKVAFSRGPAHSRPTLHDRIHSFHMKRAGVGQLRGAAGGVLQQMCSFEFCCAETQDLGARYAREGCSRRVRMCCEFEMARNHADGIIRCSVACP